MGRLVIGCIIFLGLLGLSRMLTPLLPEHEAQQLQPVQWLPDEDFGNLPRATAERLAYVVSGSGTSYDGTYRPKGDDRNGNPYWAKPDGAGGYTYLYWNACSYWVLGTSLDGLGVFFTSNAGTEASPLEGDYTRIYGGHSAWVRAALLPPAKGSRIAAHRIGIQPHRNA